MFATKASLQYQDSRARAYQWSSAGGSPSRVGNDYDSSAGGFLVAAMWSYANGVLRPAQVLKHAGIPVVSPLIGEMPQKLNRTGLGPKFHLLYKEPVLLDHET